MAVYDIAAAINNGLEHLTDNDRRELAAALLDGLSAEPFEASSPT